MWQRRHLSLVAEHLLDLKTQGYLGRLLDLEEVAKECTRELDDSSLETWTHTIPFPVFVLLYSSGNLMPIFFQDGFNFLLQICFLTRGPTQPISRLTRLYLDFFCDFCYIHIVKYTRIPE